MYRIILSDQARKDYQYFLRSGNTAIIDKIKALLNDIAEHPYAGIGKPEPLKYELAGKCQDGLIQSTVSFTLYMTI